MDSPAIAMFSLIIAQGRGLVHQRDAIEERAHTALADNADYQRLRQIPGICPIIAMTILAEAGDLRRFQHHRQFLKFCGLDLATYQSGQFRGNFWQCPPSARILGCRPGRDPPTRQQLPSQVRALHCTRSRQW